MAQVFPFALLPQANLLVDAVYEGGPGQSMSADPLARLIPGAGNQGGFRQVGPRSNPRLVILYSSLDDPDWPDFIDPYTGVFTYFGDNKQPGKELHKTHRGGNDLLRSCFERVHSHPPQRSAIPPFLVFTRDSGRDVRFRGLACPGVQGVTDDLVAVWRSKKGERFQNYRATFTILDVAEINREWIEALSSGKSADSLAPARWQKWIQKGVVEALTAEPTIAYRSQAEQTPQAGRDAALVQTLYEYFKDDPTEFEPCAAQLAAMMDQNISNMVITRRAVDGGRDATGEYLIGPIGDRIALNFSLEAKCYAPQNGVGVRELSRLISRIRHREFGLLVTTSFLARQAYEELRLDRHPIVVISGTDIAKLLVATGRSTPAVLRSWLESAFKKRDP